jgi:S1-C subfamily serine protease
LSEKGGLQRFLGTGFFVGANGMLLTCSHVLDDWSVGYGVVTGNDLRKAQVLAKDSSSDVAVLWVDGYVPPTVFEFGEEAKISSNRSVCCLEYGPTVIIGNHFKFEAATRLGNVTRKRDMTGIIKRGTQEMLELSFPGLRGASGAAVVPVDRPGEVWGMVMGNTAYELHPAHVETIYDNDNKVSEETRFYLPQGLAINVRYLKAALSACTPPS